MTHNGVAPEICSAISENNVFTQNDEMRWVKEFARMFEHQFNSPQQGFRMASQSQRIFDNTPVFLVERSMAGKSVPVPGSDFLVPVPDDSCTEQPRSWDKSDMDRWLDRYRADAPSGSPDDARFGDSGVVFSDPLGVYVRRDDGFVAPCRIYLWVDKIADCVRALTPNADEVGSNIKALFELELFHQMGHALMDVVNYGYLPRPEFACDDPVYLFYEEAHANALALCIWDDIRHQVSHFTHSQYMFVKSYVRSQPTGYCDGWALYHEWRCCGVIDWMVAKVMFNWDVAQLLCNRWREGGRMYIPQVAEVVGEDRVAVMNHEEKFGLMEFSTRRMLTECKYNYIWNRGEGLYMVQIAPASRCWSKGYIDDEGNEVVPAVYQDVRDFVNGLTLARKDGKWGIIDMQNRVRLPFVLDYDDVRWSDDGNIIVKGANNKWGMLDPAGRELIPCQYDQLSDVP